MGIYKYSLENDVLVIKTGRGQYKFRIENAELLDNVDCIAGTLISELQSIDDKQGARRDELSHYAKLLLATLNICERHTTLEKKYEQLNQTVETLQQVKTRLDHSSDSVAAERYGHISEKTYTSIKEPYQNNSTLVKSPVPQQPPSAGIPVQTIPSSDTNKGALNASPAKADSKPGPRVVTNDSPGGNSSKEAKRQPKPDAGRVANTAPGKGPAVPSSAATVATGRLHSGQRVGFQSNPDSTVAAAPSISPESTASNPSSGHIGSIKAKNVPGLEKTKDSSGSVVDNQQGLPEKKDVSEPFQSINPSAQYHLGASAERLIASSAAAVSPTPVPDSPALSTSPPVLDRQATSNHHLNSETVPGKAVSGRKPLAPSLAEGKSSARSMDTTVPEPPEQPDKVKGPEKAVTPPHTAGSPHRPNHKKGDSLEKPLAPRPRRDTASSGRTFQAASSDRLVSPASTVSTSPQHAVDTKTSTTVVLSGRQDTSNNSRSPDARSVLARADAPLPVISPPVAVRSSAKPVELVANTSHVKRDASAVKEQVAASNLPQSMGRERLSGNEKMALTGKPVVPAPVQGASLPQRSGLVSPANKQESSASVDVDSPSSISTAVVPASSPSYIINTPEHNKHLQLPAGAPVPVAGEYTLPQLSFLKNTCSESEVDRKRIRSDAELLEKKLGYFGIKGEVMGISPGPVITTYEYKPDPGIKISKIVNLADDLALALSAYSIRIVAPIPGKDVMGIEIPNIKKSLVPFIDIVTSSAFTHSTSKVPICLGKDIIGNPVVVELESMPHLLIAGATGTGKSVGLNAMITSILYKASPDEVKFLMIDPKRIELSFYNDIPHLLTPVITDMNKANIALQWMVREMDRRYNLLAHFQVRHIEQFNQKLAAAESPQYDEKGEQLESLPFIVVIIDELADLMMTASRDIEFSLTRLAQMARAAGIHLILATQRPSVDVLTGIIKANFPTRISFQVSSKTDSRTIIDSNGAETLLGNGDMLFVPPGTARLTRVHGTYLSEEELFDITSFIKKQRKPEYIFDVITEQEPDEMDSNIMDDEYDEKYNEALEVVLATRQASISGIQRALRVGYNRAARIIDLMEKKGVVGPSDGVKPRKVLANGMHMM